jgi:hypothetical protein
MSIGPRPLPCPECGKLMRFVAAKAAERKFLTVAKDDDPMHWPDVWNLFKGELQPPKEAHQGSGAAGREP